MKLIDNWRSAWKHYSKISLALIVLGNGISTTVPSAMQMHIPFLTGITWSDSLQGMTTLIGVLGLIGGFINQVTEDETP